ncbi:hypothetical protein B0O99DRAFT_656906 [Bisporella sp. PMI_857]|nr:hypothetical protein B0O99DRAFT_656906 [Bisporella sp. PMI_857]
MLSLPQFLSGTIGALFIKISRIDNIDILKRKNFAHQWSNTTANIYPVNCVSHNDYWRTVPLFTAISSGCVGVEADVWSFDDQEDIFVGHTSWTLTREKTLRDLYVRPLMHLLQQQNHRGPQDRKNGIGLGSENSGDKDLDLNGVFESAPSQTLILLIDFKTSGPKTLEKLNVELSPLRRNGYLTHYNATGLIHRPVTVVASGDAPFDLLSANETYRDIFFDAPLEELADLSHNWPNPNLEMDPKSVSTKYNSANSYYASTSFTRSIGHIKGSRLSQEQLQLIRGQIRGAHQRGLKVRYWGLPQWPRGLRNHVWHILVREGADLINADDLDAASWGDWRRRRPEK